MVGLVVANSGLAEWVFLPLLTSGPLSPKQILFMYLTQVLSSIPRIILLLLPYRRVRLQNRRFLRLFWEYEIASSVISLILAPAVFPTAIISSYSYIGLMTAGALVRLVLLVWFARQATWAGYRNAALFIALCHLPGFKLTSSVGPWWPAIILFAIGLRFVAVWAVRQVDRAMGIGTIPVAGIVLVIGGFILVSLLVRTFQSNGLMVIQAAVTLGLGLVILSAAYFLRIRTALNTAS